MEPWSLVGFKCGVDVTLGTWVSGKFRSAGGVVGLEDLRGLLQSKHLWIRRETLSSSSKDAPVQVAVRLWHLLQISTWKANLSSPCSLRAALLIVHGESLTGKFQVPGTTNTQARKSKGLAPAFCVWVLCLILSTEAPMSMGEAWRTSSQRAKLPFFLFYFLFFI